jgi:hypothetical protein
MCPFPAHGGDEAMGGIMPHHEDMVDAVLLALDRQSRYDPGTRMSTAWPC